jgi:hypothetical protein
MHQVLQYALANWISIAALGVSSFLLYRDHLLPFRLELRSGGRITVAKNPFSEGLKQDCVFLDLIFTNLGARRGVMEDVAVLVGTQAEGILLRTHSVATDRTLQFLKELRPPQLEPFTAFELKNDESAARRILFVPLTGAESFVLKTGSYTAEVWARSSAQRAGRDT